MKYVTDQQDDSVRLESDSESTVGLCGCRVSLYKRSIASIKDNRIAIVSQFVLLCLSSDGNWLNEAMSTSFGRPAVRDGRPQLGEITVSFPWKAISFRYLHSLPYHSLVWLSIGLCALLSLICLLDVGKSYIGGWHEIKVLVSTVS